MRVSKAYDAMLKGTPRPMSADLWYICRTNTHTYAAVRFRRHNLNWDRICPVLITKGLPTAETRLTDTYTSEQIRGALAYLARKLAIRHIELAEHVTRRQSHLAQVRGVPVRKDSQL